MLLLKGRDRLCGLTLLLLLMLLLCWGAADALQHHWADLLTLSEPAHWPRRAANRRKLFFRLLKDQGAAQEQLTAPDRDERHDALVRAYATAQAYYAPTEND